MFRKSARPIFLASSIATTLAATATFTFCDWQQGFPQKLKAPVQSSPLLLSGVGMRRKNLYVMEVDVYLAALNLSPEAFAQSQAVYSNDVNASIAEAIMTPVKNGSGCKAAVTLRFVRNVEKDKIVEAFNDAFKGLDESDVIAFKGALSHTVGESGLKKGEEIAFFWTLNGVVITKNGEVGDKFKSTTGDGVERRLLEVYVDPRRAVSPELIKSIKEHVGQASTLAFSSR